MSKLKSTNNYQWKWHWWCVSIGLYCNYIDTQKSLAKSSSWITDSIIDSTISASKNIPLAGSSYFKLPKELDHPRKKTTNIQNIHDNECFK